VDLRKQHDNRQGEQRNAGHQCKDGADGIGVRQFTDNRGDGPPEAVGKTHHQASHHGAPFTSKYEPPRLITVGKVADRRLDNEGQQAHRAGNDTDLGQSETEFVDKNREKRVDKGSVKVAGKMNEGQSEKDFQIGGSCHVSMGLKIRTSAITT